MLGVQRQTSAKNSYRGELNNQEWLKEKPFAQWKDLSKHSGERYFATGIVNSAPFSMLSDHRCITDFCLV